MYASCVCTTILRISVWARAYTGSVQEEMKHVSGPTAAKTFECVDGSVILMVDSFKHIDSECVIVEIGSGT